MICQLCKKLRVRSLRKVKGVEIFECRKCQLGFIDQNTELHNELYQNIRKNNLYDFQEYSRSENNFRKRFQKLVGEILKYKNSGRVLDVGAGFGLFSSILQNLGNFKLEIIEPRQILQFNIKLEQK